MSGAWWARITCPDCGDVMVSVAMLAIDTESGAVAVDCPYCGRRWSRDLTADRLAELAIARDDEPVGGRVRCAAPPRPTRPRR